MTAFGQNTVRFGQLSGDSPESGDIITNGGGIAPAVSLSKNYTFRRYVNS